MSPFIVPSGNFAELFRTVTCMVLKARPTAGVLLAPCHDEFRGSRSDYVRQMALGTTTTTGLGLPSNTMITHVVKRKSSQFVSRFMGCEKHTFICYGLPFV
ncbi:hypothetical protein TNCV_2078691 [Trichonephila clavipes]|nr:hypothetical protein TNCV_2078691 [Trichonephila clavipes]